MTSVAERRRGLTLMRKFARRRGRLTSQEIRFKESLKHLIDDLELIFSDEVCILEFTYLRRLALSVKQLSYDAGKIESSSRLKSHAHRVIHFLETPWGAPTATRRSLIKAADHFSEQNPKFSDLREWVYSLTWYGPIYKKLILSMLHE